MINADFKFDLADYLGEGRNAPVKSLGEILDRGLYHTRPRSRLSARATPSRRATPTRRVARASSGRRCGRRSRRCSRSTASTRSSIRRCAASRAIGEAQGGTNCQFSAHSGLPALGVPAGFSDDGLPVGIDCSARVHRAGAARARLRIEQTLKLRAAAVQHAGAHRRQATRATHRHRRFLRHRRPIDVRRERVAAASTRSRPHRRRATICWLSGFIRAQPVRRARPGISCSRRVSRRPAASRCRRPTGRVRRRVGSSSASICRTDAAAPPTSPSSSASKSGLDVIQLQMLQARRILRT